jgi:Outer membrane protein Omp28./CARDB.
MSRADWTSASSTIMAESSCVNVAAQSSIDISTRVLTVNVEAYYTSNSTSASNKLNVALLQNNLEGPQTGGSSHNATQVLPNGNYNHMHMLRHLITGQYGEDIDTTTTGTFISRTYTYTIPADLNSVAYDLFNMEVVVFMSEGNEDIISGSKSSMSFIVPAGTSLVDLEASGNMANPSDYCASSITPSIKVKNNSSVAVPSFDVSYSINGGTPVSNTISTSLASGSSTTYDFSSVSTTSGSNSISYSVSVSGSYYDSISSNNSVLGNSFNIMSNSTIGTTHTENFEGSALYDES